MSEQRHRTPPKRRRLKPRPTDPDIEGMRHATSKRLAPFLAVCLACGNETSIQLDEIPACPACKARRWGIAACAHCRALVEAA